MCTLRALVKRDESLEASNQPAAETGPTKVTMKDFTKALTRVLPSVSKRDEGLYRALEGSLRKSRSAITGGSEEKKEVGPQKPTPMKFK